MEGIVSLGKTKQAIENKKQQNNRHAEYKICFSKKMCEMSLL